MRTNSDKNLDMISCIDDDIIERNSIQRYNLLNKTRTGSKKRWMSILSVAASFILIATILVTVFIPKLSNNEPAYIVNVTKTSSIENTDIYTITYSDGYETSFTILNNPSQSDAKVTGVSATQSGEITLTMAGGNSINIGSFVGASREEDNGNNVSGVVINENGELSLNLVSKESLNLGKVHGSKGDKDTFLTAAMIDKNGELVIGFSTGEVITLGKVVGEKGEDGIGIKSMSVNENGELTVTLTNDTTLNLGNIKGNDGIGIKESKINENGELVLTYTDDTSVNLGRVVGKDGQDGVGIKNVNINENGELTVTLTNGTVVNLGNIKGEDGIGIKESKINENGELVLTYTDDTSVNLGRVVGKDGQDGVGIAEIKITQGSELEIILTDGSVVNLGNIKGEDGKDGKSAYELYKEKFGYEGTEEEWLFDLANGNLASKQKFEVRFDTNGGNEIPSLTVVEGGKITQPETPTKSGYTFDGWYVGNEKWSFAGGSVTENITLTAKWSVVTYNITYTLNGGILDSITTTYTVEDEITLSEPIIIGGTFIGWTYEGQDTPKKDVKIPLGSTKDITFVANWDKNAPLFSSNNVLIYNEYYSETRYSNVFSDYRTHTSVDFYCPDTSEVLSISNGTVVKTGTRVVIKLCDNLYLNYANIEETSLKVGDTIKIGDKVGSFTSAFNMHKGVCISVCDNDLGTKQKNVLDYYDYYDFYKITYEGAEINQHQYKHPTMYASGTEHVFEKGADKELYSFDTWCIDSEYNTPLQKISSDMAEDITVYAKYTYFGLYLYLESDNTYTVIGADSELIECTIPAFFNGVPVSAIASGAFKNCANLKSVVISEGVSAIYGSDYQSNSFYGCTNLESITIPSSMTRIEYLSSSRYYEGGNGMLKSVYYNGTVEQWRSISFMGVPLQGGGENGVCLYMNGELLTSLTITDDSFMTTIPFANCSSITSVTIKEGVTRFVLTDLRKITEVTIPSSVTYIEGSSFSNCTSLKSVTILGEVTSIGEYAFKGCTSLASVIIPSSVTMIGNSAFYDCTSLTIYCEAESQPSTWTSDWNYSSCPVVWGHTHSYTDGKCTCGKTE